MKKILLFLFAAIRMVGCNQNNVDEKKNVDAIGFTLYETPFSGYYYRFELWLDDMYIQNSMAETDYTAYKITKNNLPYTCMLDDPTWLSFDDSYIIRVIYSADISSDGYIALEEKVKRSDLMNRHEYIVTDPNGTKVGLLSKTYK